MNKQSQVNTIRTMDLQCFPDEPLSRGTIRYYVKRGTVVTKDYGYYILSYPSTKYTRLYSIAIIPSCRGLGLSKILLQEAMDLTKEQGYTKLRLEVDVYNTLAINLYSNLGFSIIGIKKNYYKNGDDACQMELKLTLEDDDE